MSNLHPHALAFLSIVGLALLAAPSPARAIQPETWRHTSEADFQTGTSEQTVVTSLGDIKLGAATSLLLSLEEEGAIIYDLEAIDGVIYLAAGPTTRLIRFEDGESETVLELESEQIFALGRRDGQLLVALSGENSRLARLEDGELVDLVTFEGTRYIWDFAMRDAQAIVATGVEGKLFKVDLDAEDAEPIEWLDTEQKNLLCLGIDDKGRAFVGTDQDGLVYRIAVDVDEAEKAEPFVMYDAKEPEIGAMLVRDDGMVYFATSDARQARPGRINQPEETEMGRPEQPATPGNQPRPEPMDEEADAAGEGGEETAPAEGVDSDATIEAADDAEMESPVSPDDSPTEAAVDQPGPPATQEQLDALRAEVRRRLLAARDTGTLQVSPAATANQGGTPIAVSRRGGAANRTSPKPGNAIYQITPDGFVSEIFRESVVVHRILADGSALLASTGDEGEIYRINPASEEAATILVLQAAQIPAMMRDDQGRIFIGSANPASLLRLDDGLATEGRFTSEVLDATQTALWGNASLLATIPQGTSIQVETRTGNVEDPQVAPWSPWSQPHTFEHEDAVTALSPRRGEIASPPARFMQYRLSLRSEDPAVTPIVDAFELTRVIPNLRPVVESLDARYPDDPPPGQTRRPAQPRKPNQKAGDIEHTTVLNVQWKASDPNTDTLMFALEYRAAGSKKWITIEDQLPGPQYQWDTLRVPDGRYLLRLTASDHTDNPPRMARTHVRRSEPIVVDNSRPSLSDVTVKVNDQQEVIITGKASDAVSSIESVHYSLGSEDDWQLLLPEDMIYDSTSEIFSVTIADLSPGSHAVMLRVVDARRNSYYQAVEVEVR